MGNKNEKSQESQKFGCLELQRNIALRKYMQRAQRTHGECRVVLVAKSR